MSNLIATAEKLVRDGKCEEAVRLFTDGASADSIDPPAMQDLVNILLAASCYDDALKVMHAYESMFAQPWSGDFSFDDVSKLKARSQPGGDERHGYTFKRLSLMERGAPSNCFTLFPVRKITISENALEITRMTGIRRYLWKDIIEVRVTSRKTIGFGPAHSIRKTCRIKAADQTYKFDVSAVFPDFENPRRLLNELKAHAKVYIETPR